VSRGADGTLAVPVPNDRVRATYDRTAGLYARTVARLEAASQRWALDRLDLPGATVLEVGCGPGRTLATVAQRVGPDGRAVGVDAAPAMVRAARERLAERGPEASIAVALGDARRLPLATGAADVVCAMDVLDLFERADLAAVLEECRRVLGSDGRLCVVTMDRAAVPDSWFLRAYELAYERVPGFARVGCRPIPAVEAVRAAGFDVLSTAQRRRAGVWPVTVLTAGPTG
jgi:ubiquinone/menaquinone biosynthesis C-methylase UbiE